MVKEEYDYGDGDATSFASANNSNVLFVGIVVTSTVVSVSYLEGLRSARKKEKRKLINQMGWVPS